MLAGMTQDKGWQRVCRGDSQPKQADLIFYYNADINPLPNVKDSLDSIAKQESIVKCFNRVRVVTANMPPEMDGYPKGPCNQFFRMYLDSSTRELFAPYKSIYYMEPDITPIRSFWLDTIH